MHVLLQLLFCWFWNAFWVERFFFFCCWFLSFVFSTNLLFLFVCNVEIQPLYYLTGKTNKKTDRYKCIIKICLNIKRIKYYRANSSIKLDGLNSGRNGLNSFICSCKQIESMWNVEVRSVAICCVTLMSTKHVHFHHMPPVVVALNVWHTFNQ